uniref:Retroviral polymerase SH3-like domain-containing protein n=1 Tax=Tanacetum cinerariifolium TaxID=118510 RepID=A0A6L2NI68_TANCI|nr:hypothetical protein [Tanacetum cinerariifolium]
MESLSPQVVSAAKLPILNPNEFYLWKMRIEQYFLMTDYSLWEVILNGDSPISTRVIEGVALTTGEQRLARKNELKARGTLLMALPDKHQLKFNIHKDAKTLMEAIEKRLQKLISQLEILGESLSQEDINLKFLRSLLAEWRTRTLIWRNKTDLEDQSLDDLFNSLKIYEAEVKISSSASNSTQNIAFVSSQNTDSTNESVSAVASVSAASAKVLVSALPNVDTLSNVVIYFFFASQPNSPRLDNDDLKQIDVDDLEKWHFARECMSPKDTKRNVHVEPQRRNVPVETSTSNALVSQCDGVGSYDWSFQAEEEPTNYSLVAFTSSSSSSSDNEVASCSKACTKAYATLQFHYDKMTNDLRKSQFDVISYKTRLEFVEARILVYQQNETVFEEDIKLLKLDVQLRDNALAVFSSETDESLFASPIYDRYHSGEGYHDVPPPYTGTFMPPKPDLVFHDAPTVNKTVHSAFNVSDSEDESEAEPSQNAPSFVSPTEQVKPPRPFVKPVEHSIPAANLKTVIPKPKTHGNSRNRKTCFVLLTRSKLVPLTVVRPVTTAVTRNNVIRPRPAKTVGTKPYSPPRRTINHRPSPLASNFPPQVTTVKTPKGTCPICNFEEINGGYVAFGGNPKGGKISGIDMHYHLMLIVSQLGFPSLRDKVLRESKDPLRLSRKNELKARGTLLMALPDKNQLKFNIHKDAKSLLEAIEKRFGRNKETKKVQKTLLKQQYKNFTGSSSESVDQIHDRLQKLISQLEILGESLSQEDINLKFLRSLPTDLKIYEAEVKSSSSTSPTTQNIAFVSSQNTDSTNESVSAVTSVSAANTKFLVSALLNVDTLSDIVIYSFFASQSNSPQLDNDDLKQIDADDLEEIDLKWQMVMLTMRAMRSPKDTRNKETQRRNVLVETSTSNALVSQCDGVGSYDWSFQAEEEPTNYAIMAFTSSSSFSSDNEVASCSKACTKAYATLQSHYDKLTNDLRESQFDVLSYKTGLEYVEARIVVYQQNETVFEEDIKLLKLDVMLRENTLVDLRKKFKKAEQERDKLGYDNQVFNKTVFDYDEMFSSESDVSIPTSPVHDRYWSGEGYHVVPPPYTGTFMPSKHDLVFHDVPTVNETIPTAFNVSDLEDESEGEPMLTQKAPSFVQTLKHVKTPRPSVKSVDHPIPAENLRKDITKSRAHRNSWNKKACFVCKSFTHLIKDCDYYEKKMVQKPIRNHAMRGNHQHYERMIHPNPHRHVVPTSVLTRPTKHDVTKAYSPSRRPINLKSSPTHSNFYQKVTTVKTNLVNVVQGVKGNWGNPQHALKDKGVIDSGCLRHMTGNISYLFDFKEINGGYVAFGGNPKGGKITGKGKIKTDTECIVLSSDFKLPDDNHVLLRVPKENNMYNVDLRNIVPSEDLTCLFAKATLDEFNLYIGFMRPFGCHVTIINTIDPLGKFDGKADEGFLVGYSVSSKDFRVFNSITRIVQKTLHINFLENQPNVARSRPTWLFDIDTLTKSMNYQPVITGNQPNSSAGIQKHFDADKAGEGHVQQYVLFPLWSSSSKDPQNTDADATFEVKEPESEIHVSPSSSATTKKHDDKKKREAKGTSPVELSTGVRNLSEEFADFSSNNTNEVNAASTLAPAVRQISTNSTNTFSVAGPSNTVVNPTLRNSSYVDPSPYPDDPDMPALEDVTYSNDEEDVGADADFSNLETNITVSLIPTTRVHKDHPVTQIIGDLSSAPQTGSMTRMVKEQEPKRVHQALKDPSWIEAMKEELLQFKMKKKQDGIFISQDKYVPKILRKFGLTNGKSASTPNDTEKPLLKDPDGEDVDVHIYRLMIGSLMYLTSSRPDIMFAVYACARFQATPKASHLHAVKRIFRYLKGKPYLGLWYLKDSPFNLVAYSDSGYAGASLDRKSTTGGCQFLGCKLISWQCKKQTVVATSFTEAEYVAAASCCAQVLWIQNQLLDYGEGFEQVIEFLNESVIQYALMVNPTIYVSCVKQFWSSVLIKKTNDVVRLQALIDRKKAIITKDTVRQALRLDDAESIDCLPKEEIFAELARMGYEKPYTKLTFYKAFFLAQWKFLIHTILLYTPLFEGMLVPQQIQVDIDAVTEDEDVVEPTPLTPATTSSPQQELILSTSQVVPTPPPLPHQSPIALPSSPSQQKQPSQTTDISMDLFNTLLETCTTLTRKVENLEQDKIAQALEITKLKQRVRRLEKKSKLKDYGLKILRKVGTTQRVESSADTGRLEESQAKVYHLDLEHAQKVLSMQDDEVEPAELTEVIKVVTIAKLMTEVVTAATATTAATTITAAPSATKRRNGVVIRDPEETATPSVIVHSESNSKDNVKIILVEEPKPLKKQAHIEQDEAYARELKADLNANINWNEVIEQVKRKEKQDNTVMRYQALKRKPQTEAQARKNMMHFNSIVSFLEKGEEELEEESSKIIKRKNETSEEKAAKKQKLNEEVKELRTHLQIVPNDEDDVYTEATPLALKKTIQERFASSEPKNFSDDFLLNTLKTMFEKPNIEAHIWKSQRGSYGLAKVKSWKLLESCGVHIITFTTTQMILLVERRYPLTRFTLDQMLNNVRLKVEEESEVSLELLRFIKRQQQEGYRPE